MSVVCRYGLQIYSKSGDAVEGVTDVTINVPSGGILSATLTRPTQAKDQVGTSTHPIIFVSLNECASVMLIDDKLELHDGKWFVRM